MQAQLFGINNAAYVQRSTDRNAQDGAKMARLEAQLIKTQKELAEVKAARNELKNLNKKCLAKIEDQSRRIDDLIYLVKQLEKPSAPAWGKMPLEVWRRLVQLCHPDKHDGSAAANSATQWLNQNKPPV